MHQKWSTLYRVQVRFVSRNGHMPFCRTPPWPKRHMHGQTLYRVQVRFVSRNGRNYDFTSEMVICRSVPPPSWPKRHMPKQLRNGSNHRQNQWRHEVEVRNYFAGGWGPFGTKVPNKVRVFLPFCRTPSWPQRHMPERLKDPHMPFRHMPLCRTPSQPQRQIYAVVAYAVVDFCRSGVLRSQWIASKLWFQPPLLRPVSSMSPGTLKNTS